jgi:transcriptional regulator with XRE-family HTH domain
MNEHLAAAMKEEGLRLRSIMMQRGISPKQLARGCQVAEKTVGRWLRGERRPVNDNKWAIVKLLEIREDEVWQDDAVAGAQYSGRDLRRREDISPDGPVRLCQSIEQIAVTSHKFVPLFVGPQSIPAIVDAFGLSIGESSAGQCWSGPIAHSSGSARLYLFAWGTALAHIAENLELSTIAALARWRVKTYSRDIEWLGQQISAAVGYQTAAAYVFSVYWLDRGIWPAPRLEPAVRLLSMPRVLLGESDPEHAIGAEQYEDALLHAEFDDPGIVGFGVPGTSLGAASWSSVAYHPLVPPRALAPKDIVDVELLTQAIWSYARAICDQIEAGVDPTISPDYGIRFLRGMQSRCFTARPQESSAHRSMREAIVQTSGLADQLDAAMAALRDT